MAVKARCGKNDFTLYKRGVIMKLVILDYGVGNIKSIQFAFDRLGVAAVLSSDALKHIKAADKIIFPGVGEASSAMKKLREVLV